MKLSISLTLGVSGFIVGLITAWIVQFHNGTQQGLRSLYRKEFDRVIAPCLQLGNVDLSECFENLDDAERIIADVRANFNRLKSKLLADFI